MTTIFLIYYYSCHIIKSKRRKQIQKLEKIPAIICKTEGKKATGGGRKTTTVIAGEEKDQEERDPERCVLGPASILHLLPLLAASAINLPYFFKGAATGTLGPPRSPMVLPSSVQVAQRVWRLQNIKGKKESPSLPSSFLKTAIDVA